MLVMEMAAERHGQPALTINIIEDSVPDSFYHLFIRGGTLSQQSF